MSVAQAKRAPQSSSMTTIATCSDDKAHTAPVRPGSWDGKVVKWARRLVNVGSGMGGLSILGLAVWSKCQEGPRMEGTGREGETWTD